MKAKEKRFGYAMNFFISGEMKEQLEELARRQERTLADVIRLALRTAVPILRGIWDAEDRSVTDWARRIAAGSVTPNVLRAATELSSRDADRGDRDS